MLRVLASDGMDKSAVEALEALGAEVTQQYYEPQELEEQVRQYDVLVVRSATKVGRGIIDGAVAGGRLKLIIRGGVGVDNIDVGYAKEQGIQVCNTPKASSGSVAELAIGHIFSIARYIGIANVTMREGKWEKKKYQGTEIAGKTIGLVGMGRIAQETARRAKALGMHVVYTNRTGPRRELEGYEYADLDGLLKKADYVSLHMPGQKGSPALVDAGFLGKMKEGAALINTARGSLVDEQAVLEALEQGKLRGYGVDVYGEEPCKNQRLLEHPRVSMTPHIGGSTREAQERIGEEIVEHIKREFSL